MNHCPELDFVQYMEQQMLQFEKMLPQMIHIQAALSPALQQAIDYSLMAGGKRLRPLCVLIACDSLQGNQGAAQVVACAVEMVHTYSLIHDDLPAMDNDDYRRGKLTNHKVYGEAMAILAGDGLLTHSFYCIVKIAHKYGISADIALSIVEELAYFAGIHGMVGGQAADMQGKQGKTTLLQLETIHLHKTSALIVFALRAGAKIAGASEQQLQAITAYGEKIGFAFQIQDDILDMTGDEAIVGKCKGSDIKSRKVTYPYFRGLDHSQQKVKQLITEAQAVIEQASFSKPELLFALANYLQTRKK